jgi:transketolase
MRNAFAAALSQIAAEDERVVMLSGDIGNRLFDKFKDKFPQRFFNCGVAEANMVGIAAGMAASGLRPIAYTITPFVTTRVMEQIRVDVCYHNVPVVIAGVGAGLSYASLGGTHHSCEDVAMLRSLPNMSVVCPADPVETGLALRAALKHNGPVYLRLGKKGEPVVHKTPPEFVIGRGIVVREGTGICLLSTGTVLPEAMATGESLGAQVVSFHTVKPLDVALLADVFARFKLVATIEEHSLIGGLGSAVAEWLADRPAQHAKLCRFGTPDAFLHEAGEQEYAREKFGLTPAHIAEKVLQALK